MEINNIYIFLIIIFFCPLIGRLVKSALEYYKLSKEYSKGSTLINSLIRLTPKEYQIWCGEYLSSLGYSNIIFLPIDSFSKYKNSFIICTLNNTSYCVECKKDDQLSDIQDNDIELLLGVLSSKSLSNGIILTTCPLSPNALSIINSLPEPYDINVISLCNITDTELGKYPLQLNNIK